MAEVLEWLKRPADYTAEATKLEMLIASARLTAEKYTGLLMSRRQIEVSFGSNSRRPIRLPYGPDVVIESITRVTPGYTDALLTSGIDYSPSLVAFYPASLSFPRHWRLSVGLLEHSYRAVYRAGFEELPGDLKHALLEIVAYSYRHKGDDKQGNREARPVSIPSHARVTLDQYTILVA